MTSITIALYKLSGLSNKKLTEGLHQHNYLLGAGFARQDVAKIQA
ncbi:hypothetical protein [Pantoea stewartii]|nr:hypothetical protein [Pantoea stewartii]